MKISATVILGLGGKNLSKQHIEDSAKLINECEHINYLSTLQLGLTSTKEDNFFKRFEDKNSEFIFCSDSDMLEEQRRFISLINPKKPIIFRSNHASNALPLKGTLPKDKDELIEILDIAKDNESMLRPKFMRGFWDFIAHDYEGVNKSLIEAILRSHIPKLKETLTKIIK